MSEEDEETLEDQEYGFESDPFEPDDPDSIKQDIQIYMNELSQFSKLMLVFTHLTSPEIKNLFSQQEFTYEQIYEYLLQNQMPETPPREFFLRQLRINLDKIKKNIKLSNQS